MLTMDSDLRDAIANGNMLVRLDMTLADETALTLTGDDLMLGGVTFTESTSSASSFDVGAAIMRRCDVRLRNDERQWNGYDFGDAMFVAYIGADVDGTVQWVRRGVYWVEPIRTMGEVVNITGLGNMRMLERPYSDVTTAYPATLGAIVSDVCSACGMPLLTKTFPHSGYVVNARLADKDASCAEVIAWASQAAGCFADEDEQGRLRLRWYNTSAWDAGSDLDGGTFDTDTTPYSDGDAADGGGFMYGGVAADGGQFAAASYVGITALRSITAYVNDITVTGISVTAHDEVTSAGTLGNGGEQVLAGADGYVLDVADNPLIEYGRASEVAANIAENAVGMTFRPLSAQTISDPCLQAGDAVQVTDRMQTTYTAYATTVSFSTGGTVTASCNAKSTSGYEQRERRTVQQREAEQIKRTIYDGYDFSGGDYSQTLKDYILNDPSFVSDLGSALADYGFDYSYGSLQGADGNWYGLGVDTNGNVVATLVPSAISVVTPPTQTEYVVGDAIKYDGISVKLLDGNGNDFTDDKYADGLVPYDELGFPVKVASMSMGTAIQGGRTFMASDYDLGLLPNPTPIYGYAARGGTYSRYDGSYVWTLELIPSDGTLLITTNGTSYILYAYVSKTQGSTVEERETTVFYPSDGGESTTTTSSTYRHADSAVMYEGKRAYYYEIEWQTLESSWRVPAVWYGQRFYPSNQAIWTAVWGEPSGGDRAVPVQWVSTYDGRTLETTTQITVTP